LESGGDGSSLVRLVFRFERWRGGGRVGFAFLPWVGLRLYVSLLLDPDIVMKCIAMGEGLRRERGDDEEELTHQHLA
jgi:hypothetical protein